MLQAIDKAIIVDRLCAAIDNHIIDAKVESQAKQLKEARKK